jgi:hypothetical protein
VAGTCKSRNEPLGSIKCGAFLNWMRIGALLKKDSAPCSKYCFFIQFYIVFNKFYDVFVNGMTSLAQVNMSITVWFFCKL